MENVLENPKSSCPPSNHDPDSCESPSVSSIISENAFPPVSEIVKHPALESGFQKEGFSKKGWRREQQRILKLARRPVLRKLEKERRKAKKEQAKEDGTFVGKPRKYKMSESANKQRICIDLDFSSLMNENDMKGTMNQVNFSYGYNRRMSNPFQLYFCGIDDAMMKVANQKLFFNNWDVHLYREKIDSVFRLDEIVYLCAESENVLEKFDETKVYVIGGLLDHNHHKSYCYEMAKRKGYGHARLPIQEHIKLETRKVLTINQVFDILCKYSMNNDWKQALIEVIPQRKQLHSSGLYLESTFS